MILITELSTRTTPPSLLSDGQAVWRFSFAGDETYIDDLGVQFVWRGINNQILDIRGVALGPTNYLEVDSVASCQAAEESFFWDSANKTIYVHHPDNVNDYSISRAAIRFLESSAGYASGVLRDQPSYYPVLYFDPSLQDIGRLAKRVDPLKFGIISFESSSYQLDNADGQYDGFTNQEALNSQVRFVLMQQGQTNIDDGVRIFTGYTGGASRSDQALEVQLQEARTFYNRSACPNVFTTTDYPSIDDKFVNKPIPVAYGDIRRGIAVPINTAGFDKDAGGVVTFKLADDSLHAIRAVTALYDDAGNALTPLGTINLSDCTVQYDVPPDAELDLKSVTWEGEGYDLPGALDYNHGLDIVRDIFENQGQLFYGASTFDTTQWDAQAAAQTSAIGISIQSDRGLIEQLVEPITVSLQGVVDILGDGRVTFLPRDPAAPVTRSIDQSDIVGEPTIRIEAEDVVSNIIIEYAANSNDDDDVLTVDYTQNQGEVSAAYGVLRTRPVSPVRTALTTEANAILVAEEIATTSSDPQTIIEVRVPLSPEQYQLFQIVQVDIGRPRKADVRVCEILGRVLSLEDGQLFVDLTMRELPDRTEDQFSLLLGFGYEELLTDNYAPLILE